MSLDPKTDTATWFYFFRVDRGHEANDMQQCPQMMTTGDISISYR